MSCRVLHRGVEHSMVRRLASLAQSRGCDRLAFRWRPTDRNWLGGMCLKSISPAAKHYGMCHGDPAGVDAAHWLPQDWEDNAATVADLDQEMMTEGWVVMSTKEAAQYEMNP